MQNKLRFIFMQKFLAGLLLAAGPLTAQVSVINEQGLSKQARLLVEGTQDERREASEHIAGFLRETLPAEEAFLHPFDSLPTVSRLHPEDKSFRILTWQVRQDSGGATYHGFLVFPDRKENRVIELSASPANPEEATYRTLKPEQWAGALYYQIITTVHKRKKYYTLLGYNQVSTDLQQKVVDALVADKRGKNVRFGAPVFLVQDWQDQRFQRRPYRLFYRYSRQFTATLKYLPSEEKIIMDHLSPPDASMKKNYRLYGPDFSYDALVWEEDHWVLKEGVEFNSGIHAPIRPPAPRPQPK